MTSRLFTLRSVRSLGRLTILALVAGAVLVAPVNAQAAPAVRPYEYHLINLALPPGMVLFEPAGITDDRRVYGTGYRCDDSACYPSVMVYKGGREAILHDGRAIAVNAFGVVGGSLLLDPVAGVEQAAVFIGTQVRIIPRRPGETTSSVIGMTNFGTALVSSYKASTDTTEFYLYDARKKITPLNFGPGEIGNLSINDDNIIAGTITRPASLGRAFRYDASTGVMTTLEPVQANPLSWGQGINRRGDVLGYSWGSGTPERIGVWRDQKFQTYFVEGTAEFPTISNNLLWNRNGLIVITNSRNDPNSYLVPKPNMRIKVTDLAGALPAWTLVTGINARGDLIGFAGDSYGNYRVNFLLERVNAR